MASRKSPRLNGMSFEQLLDRMWRESEKSNPRETERKSIPPKKIRVAGRAIQKQSVPKPHVRSTAA